MLYQCIWMMLLKTEVPQWCNTHKLLYITIYWVLVYHSDPKFIPGRELYSWHQKYKSIQNASYFLYLNQTLWRNHSFELSRTDGSNEDQNIYRDRFGQELQIKQKMRVLKYQLSYFWTKPCGVSTHLNCLGHTIQMMVTTYGLVEK